MKDLTSDEFLGKGIDHLSRILLEAAKGEEIFRISTWNSGSFVIMSEDEYTALREAMAIVLQSSNLSNDEVDAE